MDTEQKDMYANLPGELYSVVSGVAIQRDIGLGRALEAIITEWSKGTSVTTVDKDGIEDQLISKE